MGNAESQPVRNVDKRTARRDHAPKFIGAIAAFKESKQVLRSSFSAEGPHHSERAGLRVVVRRRPIFRHETTAGEFDVLTTQAAAGTSSEAGGQSSTDQLVVHNCRMHADCKVRACGPPARIPPAPLVS